MDDLPRWDTYAELEGAAFRNWRKRRMEPVIGTLARCVGRWLELHPLGRIDCSVRWGSREAGAGGRLNHGALKAFVREHGLPPGMVESMGGQPGQEAIEALLAEHAWTPSQPPTGPAKDAAHLCEPPQDAGGMK